MGVYNLSHGANQPFYNVLAHDGSCRYASQGNLLLIPRSSKVSYNYKHFADPAREIYSLLLLLVKFVRYCFRSHVIQSQKTQDFCVADFASLSDERRSRSKILALFIWIKEPCVRKFEGLERSKRLGISQTIITATTFAISFNTLTFKRSKSYFCFRDLQTESKRLQRMIEFKQ